MKYMNIKTGDISGVTVSPAGAYCEINGKYYKVIGVLPKDKRFGIVPVLDIPQMSDERLMKLAREHPASNTVKG